MRELCEAYDLAGINKDRLNKGILTGKFTTAFTFAADDMRSQVSFDEERIARRLKMVELSWGCGH